MKYTWRWFGPDDPISLAEIRQAGASGIVSALHHVPIGTAWTNKDVADRLALIEQAGKWSKAFRCMKTLSAAITVVSMLMHLSLP